MELEGHPTHDIVAELERRGAIPRPGTRSGPDDAPDALTDGGKSQRGVWLFLPPAAFDTEIDETPSF